MGLWTTACNASKGRRDELVIFGIRHKYTSANKLFYSIGVHVIFVFFIMREATGGGSRIEKKIKKRKEKSRIVHVQ